MGVGTRRLQYFLLLGLLLSGLGCEKSSPPPPKSAAASTIQVVAPAGSGAPWTIRSSKAEFHVSPTGAITAFLLTNGKLTTIDADPDGKMTVGEGVVVHGKPVDDFVAQSQPKVSAASGTLGTLGKRVEFTSESASTGLQRTVAVEVDDDFPNLAAVSTSYKNIGNAASKLDKVVAQKHDLDASQADKAAAPYQMWSFQGSSIDWGKDEIQPLSVKFSQQNVMGAPVNQGHGGGIPVNAFWTRNVGIAIGHLETLPLVLQMPVHVTGDKNVETAIEISDAGTLSPGASYAAPRTFVAVYAGDFYEPLRMYSLALQKQGWMPAKPNAQDYGIAWCGWGYQFNVTPKQMTDTIPKLKELGIGWATLDDRWFDAYGDWNPRKDTFPGDSIRKMVDDFHAQGIKAQLWWYPLVVEDGQGKWDSHKYAMSDVAKQHPDWLILNKDGTHGRSFRGLGTLCPALPEVQQFIKGQTERFIRDWGFDGLKLDNIYSVPACYNPKHHHASPQDSINAMGDVYKVIFQTARSIKPDSVVQICPCGTTPNLAWLPYMDQAVTADPVGGVQVRRRIKWYKALLGPQAAVYGDHVELSEMTSLGKDNWREHGDDFASTLGTGGVPGTKFTVLDNRPLYKDVALTTEKDAHWKKWLAIYNQKMLSRGEFKDLYVYGYDAPEAYAIEKDGAMYYAFFAKSPHDTYQGKIELRGLGPGKYRVVDYVENRQLGTIESANPVLDVSFTGSLLLEADKQP